MKHILLAGGLALASAAAASAAPLDELSWMAGHWRSDADGAVSEEAWFAPAGGLMVGVNRSVTADGEASFEFLRIEAGAEGEPAVYIAQPAGGAPARFPLVQAEGHAATFANPDHDFPQMIRYERAGDTLTATISDMEQTQAFSWSWTLAP